MAKLGGIARTWSTPHFAPGTALQLTVEGQATEFPHSSTTSGISFVTTQTIQETEGRGAQWYEIALAVDSLAWRAHTQRGADVTVENPAASFIWQLGLFERGSPKDFMFSPCMLGDDIAKPARIIFGTSDLNINASNFVTRMSR